MVGWRRSIGRIAMCRVDPNACAYTGQVATDTNLFARLPAA